MNLYGFILILNGLCMDLSLKVLKMLPLEPLRGRRPLDTYILAPGIGNWQLAVACNCPPGSRQLEAEYMDM